MNTFRRRLRAAPLLTAALLAPIIMPSSAEAATFSYQYSWSASSGFSEFDPGDFQIDHEASKLTFQSDGNLVLYISGRAVWQSRTYGRNAAKISFQSDGNIVIYRDDDTPVWASGRTRSGASGSWVLYLSGTETRPFASELNSTTATKIYWQIP